MAALGPWVKKGCHPNHGYNFVNSWSICKILSLLQTAINFQQNSYWVTHHTLSMLLHYLGKLKNQKLALRMHVKHVSSVIFYHLSNRYLPNVMKISAKINTMQNINMVNFGPLTGVWGTPTNFNVFCVLAALLQPGHRDIEKYKCNTKWTVMYWSSLLSMVVYCCCGFRLSNWTLIDDWRMRPNTCPFPPLLPRMWRRRIDILCAGAW